MVPHCPVVARQQWGQPASGRPATGYPAPVRKTADLRHDRPAAHRLAVAHQPEELGSRGQALQRRPRLADRRQISNSKTADRRQTADRKAADLPGAARRTTAGLRQEYRRTACDEDQSATCRAAVAQSCQQAAELVPRQAAESRMRACPPAKAAPGRPRWPPPDVPSGKRPGRLGAPPRARWWPTNRHLPFRTYPP